MKTLAYSFAASAAAALILAGCGGDAPSSDNSDAELLDLTDITVERGPLLDANVTDAEGQVATPQGRGVYRFEHAPVYPVSSFGGVIDINRNGVIDEGDLPAAQLRLRTSQGAAATVVTSLGQNAEVRTMLQEDFNLSLSQIYSETPTTDRTIAAISDEVFKYCIENNISDPATLTLQTMQNLRSAVEARIDTYAYDEVNASVHERELVRNELGMQVMTQGEADMMNWNMRQRETNPTPADTNLSNELKYTLAYMWNEEKLAKDLYLALNDIWPNMTLSNIATRAEAQHQATVEARIEAYDLNITNLEDFSGGYSAEALLAFAPGEYGIPELQALYEALYAKGAASAQDALEVGCMVEVTDINDLNEDIAAAEAAGAFDLVATFESLRSGSYSHYWAFDAALKMQGVMEGCCVLGDTYCKSGEEYPDGRGSMWF